MSFPLSPVDEYKYTSPDGVAFIYSASKNAWDIEIVGANAPIIDMLDPSISDTADSLISFRDSNPFTSGNYSSIQLTDFSTEDINDFSTLSHINNTNVLINGLDSIIAGQLVLKYTIEDSDFSLVSENKTLILFDGSLNNEFTNVSNYVDITLTL